MNVILCGRGTYTNLIWLSIITCVLGNSYIYINGCFLNQLKPVLPQLHVKNFGIDETVFPRLIRVMLEIVRKKEMNN
jgi:hypothetical protein